MALESIRTYDRVDLVFGVEYLYKLTYPGGEKMGDPKQRWYIIAGIKPESVPRSGAEGYTVPKAQRKPQRLGVISNIVRTHGSG